MRRMKNKLNRQKPCQQNTIFFFSETDCLVVLRVECAVYCCGMKCATIVGGKFMSMSLTDLVAFYLPQSFVCCICWSRCECVFHRNAYTARVQFNAFKCVYSIQIAFVYIHSHWIKWYKCCINRFVDRKQRLNRINRINGRMDSMSQNKNKKNCGISPLLAV